MLTQKQHFPNIAQLLFFSGTQKKNVPAIVKALPKKKKTRTTIFSALSEQEAKELANGFATRLALDVTADTVCDGVDAACADVL